MQPYVLQEPAVAPAMRPDGVDEFHGPALAARANGDRPEVGDEVFFPETGETGTVLRLHDDELPFKVLLASGRADWFADGAVTLIRRVPLHVGDEVVVKETGEVGSVIMVHDDELPFKVSLASGRVDWFREGHVARCPSKSQQSSKVASPAGSCAGEQLPAADSGPECSTSLTSEQFPEDPTEAFDREKRNAKLREAQQGARLRELEAELQRVKAQHKADMVRLCAQLQDRESALRTAEEEAYKSRIAVLDAENRAARAARLESDTRMRISLLEDSLVSLTSPDGVDLESDGELAKERLLTKSGSSAGAARWPLRRAAVRILRGLGLSARRCLRCQGRAKAREV